MLLNAAAEKYFSIMRENVMYNVQVESVGDDDEKSRYLQSSKSSRSTESGHLNPETRARLRALLESTGLLRHHLVFVLQ